VARGYNTEGDDGKIDVAEAGGAPELASWPELEAVIGPGGLLAQRLPDFERRAGQDLMMRAVAGALEDGKRLVVEAGTGIGKSLAYLLPAAVSGQRVIVSTGTKALQDQLAGRQVPFIQSELGIDIVVAVLKGRTNYLCLELLDRAADDASLTLDRHVDLGRIRTWALTTATGDRAELDDVGEESLAWRAVAADGERCLGRQCPRFDDCFLMAARRRAEAADLVIVNHHLFFADLALRDEANFSLLPDADAVVFDEAHRLEDVAAAAFGRAVSEARVTRLARDAVRAFRAAGRAVERDWGRVEIAALAAEREAAAMFEALDVPHEGRRALHPRRLPERVTEAWYRLDNQLIGLGLLAAGEATTPGADERVRRIAARVEGLRQDLAALFDPDDTTLVRWLERGPRARFIRAAPIRVGPRMGETLHRRFRTIIWTSATLSDGGAFSDFRESMGLVDEEVRELSLSSPFDYPRQALLYAPSDLPPPTDPDVGRALWPRIEALVRLTRGRALLLFTSRRRMLEAHQALAGRWEWPTFVQGEGAKERLVERFRATPGAVLFATQTFWEGVDVIGDALSLVVIDRLPFQAPGDPLADARAGELGARGRNAFMDYQVPVAILALKQGVGRLIRHREDRGIVAILDPRLVNARYGVSFLASLPPARRTGSLDELAAWWIDLERAASESPDQAEGSEGT